MTSLPAAADGRSGSLLERVERYPAAAAPEMALEHRAS
jgi:hypothetical protein